MSSFIEKQELWTIIFPYVVIMVQLEWQCALTDNIQVFTAIIFDMMCVTNVQYYKMSH